MALVVLTPSQMKLKPGDQAPVFSGLRCATCGERHSLQDFANAKALLIIFMCNHCPYVKAKLEAIKQLHAQYSQKGLALAGINSNDPTNYPEDSFEGMQQAVREKAIKFHYVFDEAQEAARAYGATCTPDPFLFDSQMRLAYHGRFDDALQPGQMASTRDMADAIEEVLAGRRPAQEFLPSIGCSIKWKR